MPLQYLLDGTAKLKVGGTEDTSAESRWTVEARSAHSGHAMNKFGFAYATHRFGAISAIEGTTLGENGLHDVVARVGDIITKVFA
jgi:hypothetical protein